MPDLTDQPKRKAFVESRHFRMVFTNSFNIRFGDNDVLIKFNMEVEPGNTNIPGIEEVGVVMTPATAKLFVHALTAIIETFENATKPIDLPEGKLEGILKSISQATRGANPRTSRQKPK